MPRRRAVVKAFASVESSCSSLNSFSAAKVDASSTDHAAAGGRRRAKEAIQAESERSSRRAGTWDGSRACARPDRGEGPDLIN